MKGRQQNPVTKQCLASNKNYYVYETVTYNHEKNEAIQYTRNNRDDNIIRQKFNQLFFKLKDLKGL